ncbi:uncharacterized protein LOC141592662 [Silene latifolia]|uniref:uncharacterized protein LOC141592662 n=1 Tax=Silene latifolia TaxID=37657 RepID=UPI003D7833F3
MSSAEKPIGSHGFRSRLEHVLYSGDKKHVFGGLVIITAIFGVPWYFMTRGSKQQSHQDYLEKADKARSERLSSSPAK